MPNAIAVGLFGAAFLAGQIVFLVAARALVEEAIEAVLARAMVVDGKIRVFPREKSLERARRAASKTARGPGTPPNQGSGGMR